MPVKAGCTVRVMPPGQKKPAVGVLLGARHDPRTQELLAFVWLRDTDRRLARWFPAAWVEAIPTAPLGGEKPAVTTRSRGPAGAALPTKPAKVAVPAASPIDQVVFSDAAFAPVPAEDRRKCQSEGAFFEERLTRDFDAPNTVRHLHYLHYTVTPWYYAPWHVFFPDFAPDTPTLPSAHLCPFTLKPLPSARHMRRHVRAFAAMGWALRPPGREIYRDAARGVSLFHVDGAVHKEYARHSFLLGRCFLQNKLCGHDVDLFEFFVVGVHQAALVREGQPAFCDRDDAVFFAGFFSHEKGTTDTNLACIVTLPCFQGRGLGNFLIAAAYRIAYRRGHVGGPERPLSDLGAVAYDAYWARLLWGWAANAAGTGAGGGVSHADPDDVAGAAEPADPGGGGGGGSAVPSLRVADVAAALRVEPADAVHALLRAGLVHRTEGRALKLVVAPEMAAALAAKPPRLPFDDTLADLPA